MRTFNVNCCGVFFGVRRITLGLRMNETQIPSLISRKSLLTGSDKLIYVNDVLMGKLLNPETLGN